MVRTYKKKSAGGRCTSVRQDAVDAVLQGLPLRTAAESFNIPKETLVESNSTHLCMILNLFLALDQLMLCPNDMRSNVPRSRGRLGHFGWVSLTINYK